MLISRSVLATKQYIQQKICILSVLVQRKLSEIRKPSSQPSFTSFASQFRPLILYFNTGREHRTRWNKTLTASRELLNAIPVGKMPSYSILFSLFLSRIVPGKGEKRNLILSYSILSLTNKLVPGEGKKWVTIQFYSVLQFQIWWYQRDEKMGYKPSLITNRIVPDEVKKVMIQFYSLFPNRMGKDTGKTESLNRRPNLNGQAYL